MSKASQERWLQRIGRTISEVASTVSDVAAEAAEAVGILEAEDPYWMLAGASPARRVAFIESIGGQFGGEPAPTTAWVLDRWMEAAPGLRWLMEPQTGAAVVSERAKAVLAYTFARTNTGILKAAAIAHGGDTEQAIIKAVDEIMTVWGLDGR